MRHLQKTWRNLDDRKIKRYRDLSDRDRVRFDYERRLRKQGLQDGAACTCCVEQTPQDLLLDPNEPADTKQKQTSRIDDGAPQITFESVS